MAWAALAPEFRAYETNGTWKKRCIRCRAIKPVAEFSENVFADDRYRRNCRNCLLDIKRWKTKAYGITPASMPADATAVEIYQAPKDDAATMPTTCPRCSGFVTMEVDLFGMFERREFACWNCGYRGWIEGRVTSHDRMMDAMLASTPPTRTLPNTKTPDGPSP